MEFPSPMELCAMCDNANIGLAFYRLGYLNKDESNDLLSRGLRIYEILEKGSKIKDPQNEEEWQIANAYYMLTSFFTEEGVNRLMQRLTSAKEALDKIIAGEIVSEDKTIEHQKLFVDLGSAFLRNFLNKSPLIEREYINT